MIVSELIKKKRDGGELNAPELEFLVAGFSRGSIPDYQISSWLMATFLRGMAIDETVTLTRLMKDSGDTMDWRSLSADLKTAHFADKHSTGGVGDKVSLILAPLAALMDLKIPMMSGRGLGHTGGTVDKLESIPGFSLFLEKKKLIDGLVNVGAIMMAQSPNLCPADKKLYALRDVTGTIESVPLITASIVSKKWAEGVDAIVYDVKCGRGAFMKNIDQAKTLATSLVKTSTGAGIKALARITKMEEPLGSRIGNSLEVIECYWILSNEYPRPELREIAKPLVNLCCLLTAEMAVLAGTRKSLAEARAECENYLKNGRALKKFEDMLKHQGAVDGWLEKLPKIKHSKMLDAPTSGTLQSIDSMAFGLAGLEIGVGRTRSEDSIDPSTGFELQVKVGDKISKGQPLCKIYTREKSSADEISTSILSAFSINDSAVLPINDLSLERVSS
jgi:pyrimidine-nucleoside phosphorylase